MADKTWIGTTTTNASTTAGAYSAADNWKPISLRSGTYRWTASGSGTNEYYVELSGGGDPSLVEPTNVQELVSTTKTNLTAGTAGSLAASEWDWADNDTLGFSTVYVRLADGADPDSKDIDHVTFTDTPKDSDNVEIGAESSQAISTGLDQSSITLTSFHVRPGYSATIGSEDEPLRIDITNTTGLFSFEGSGVSHIDLGDSNISPEVLGTATAQTGKRGLYLIGSNLNVLNVHGGSVGLAMLHGQTSTVDKIRVTHSSASVWVGSGVTISTSYYQSDGSDCRINCNCSSTTMFDGKLTTDEAAAITATVHGGEFISNATGAITITVHGGVADFLQSGVSRTITSITVSAQGTSDVKLDRNVMTVSSETWPSDRAVIHRTREA